MEYHQWQHGWRSHPKQGCYHGQHHHLHLHSGWELGAKIQRIHCSSGLFFFFFFFFLGGGYLKKKKLVHKKHERLQELLQTQVRETLAFQVLHLSMNPNLTTEPIFLGHFQHSSLVLNYIHLNNQHTQLDYKAHSSSWVWIQGYLLSYNANSRNVTIPLQVFHDNKNSIISPFG